MPNKVDHHVVVRRRLNFTSRISYELKVVPKETVIAMAKEGTPDLEHVEKWAARAAWRAGRRSRRTWTVLSMEKEQQQHGSSERAITLLYNERVHGENGA